MENPFKLSISSWMGNFIITQWSERYEGEVNNKLMSLCFYQQPKKGGWYREFYCSCHSPLASWSPLQDITDCSMCCIYVIPRTVQYQMKCVHCFWFWYFSVGNGTYIQYAFPHGQFGPFGYFSHAMHIDKGVSSFAACCFAKKTQDLEVAS